MVSASERVEEILVKSKQRVAEHGEVFTPAYIVEAMLDLVKDESERIDSRFLETFMPQRIQTRANYDLAA